MTYNTEDFFSFVEDWCTKYTPLMHDPDNNPRFFLTESQYGLMDFMRSIDSDTDAAVIMETMTEGEISMTRGKNADDYAIYFFVKAEEQGSGQHSRKALNQSREHAANFLRYLDDYIQECRAASMPPSTPFIHIDLTSVLLHPVGPLWNHWYAYYIELEDKSGFNPCTDQSMYIEP